MWFVIDLQFYLNISIFVFMILIEKPIACISQSQNFWEFVFTIRVTTSHFISVSIF